MSEEPKYTPLTNEEREALIEFALGNHAEHMPTNELEAFAMALMKKLNACERAIKEPKAGDE